MNIPTALRKKRLVLIYAVVVIVLSVVSIYNAYFVLMDYIYNNVSTKVQTKIAYNVVPFAAYFTVSMYLGSNSTWFPETWSMNESTVGDLLSGSNAAGLRRLANRKSENSFSFSNSRNELESLIDIAQLACGANSLDYTFMGARKNNSGTWAHNDGSLLGDVWFTTNPNFTDPSDFIGEKDSICTKAPWSRYPKLIPDFMSSLDSFIANPYGEKFVDHTLHHIVNFNYSSLDTNETKSFSDLTNPTFVVDELRRKHLSITFPIDMLSNRSAYGRPIEFSVYPTGSNGTPSPDVIYGAAVFSAVAATDTALGRPDLEFQIYQDGEPQANVVYFIEIKIRNHAIYNVTDVHSDQFCARCGNLTDVDDCVYKCHMDAVVDGCKCIPFTFRRLYPTDRTKNSLSLCTSQNYTTCYQAGNYNPSHCTRENCVPCVTQRNYIQSTIKKYPMENNASVWYRLIFQIRGDDKTYAVFQDIFQNSWMGMLGQLGGNLGMFLGFSLLGMWQFGVYVFVYFQKKKKKKMIKKEQNQPEGFQPRGLLFSWLKLAQMNLENDTNQQGRNGGDDELKKENETLRLDMRKFRTEMENQKSTMALLEKRLETLESTKRSRKEEAESPL